MEATLKLGAYFGAYSNETHWKKLSLGRIISLKEYIVKKTQITKSEYDEKWKSIMDFRNNFVAHKNDYNRPVPFLTFAEMVVENFELYAIEMFHPEELEHFASLSDLWETCMQDIKTTINCILTHD